MEKGDLPETPSLRGPRPAPIGGAGPGPFPDEAALLGVFARAPDPLGAVLDLLLQTLGARYVICGDLAPAARRAVGRRLGGRPIPRPERVLERITCPGSLDRRSMAADCERASRGAWRLVWPLPSAGEPRAAVIAGSPAPLRRERPAELHGRLERLLPWIALAFELSRLRAENSSLKEMAGDSGLSAALRLLTRIPSLPAPGPAGLAGPPGEDGLEFPGIIAFSPSLREVLRTVSIVAPSDATVLIEGESGTGKELIARAIHDRSVRARGPFVSENCAACPEGLLESEFFGVERGAFTGAHRTKPGLMERARAGTLFLDEIAEMDLRLQRKLLRALQEREVRRVGAGEVIPVDFRLVSATNRVLSEEARAGRFRADLLYRLEVVTLRLPPLRERPEDIPHLTRHFLALHAASAGRPPPEVEDGAMGLLCAYPWPGNVRELQNEMWRAVALGFTALTPARLSAKIIRAAARPPGLHVQALQGGRSLDDVERDLLGGLIREVLLKTRGNKIRAAKLLGIPKTTLYRRIRRYSIADAVRDQPVRDGPVR